MPLRRVCCERLQDSQAQNLSRIDFFFVVGKFMNWRRFSFFSVFIFYGLVEKSDAAKHRKIYYTVRYVI